MENKLIKVSRLGLDVNDYEDNKMDPENDYYPVPLMSNRYNKYTGIRRLMLAMFNLQVSRFRDLLLKEYINANEDELYNGITEDVNFYYRNILSIAVCTNHPTNLYYRYNYTNYDEIFWLIVKYCDIQRLNTANVFNMCPIDQILNDISNHSHYFFALLNHGLIVNDVRYQKRVADKRNTDMLDSFITSDKYKKVISSTLPKGCKLLELCDTCPITTNKIMTPIIAEDGHVYEYHALQRWGTTKGAISPILNIKMSKFVYFITDDRFGKIA